jgi:hypothetical protein
VRSFPLNAEGRNYFRRAETGVSRSLPLRLQAVATGGWSGKATVRAVQLVSVIGSNPVTGRFSLKQGANRPQACD